MKDTKQSKGFVFLFPFLPPSIHSFALDLYWREMIYAVNQLRRLPLMRSGHKHIPQNLAPFPIRYFKAKDFPGVLSSRGGQFQKRGLLRDGIGTGSVSGISSVQTANLIQTVHALLPANRHAFSTYNQAVSSHMLVAYNSSDTKSIGHSISLVMVMPGLSSPSSSPQKSYSQATTSPSSSRKRR